MATDPVLDDLSKDFRRLQQQKHRKNGGVEGRILNNLCFYHGEHYIKHTPTTLTQPKLDANKLHLVFNLIKQHFRRKIGRITSIGMRFGASPNKANPQSLNQAEIVDKMILALDAKLSQEMRQWEVLWWMLIGGVAVERTAWIPDASTEPLPRVDEATGEHIWLDSQTNEEIPDSQVTAMVEQQGRAPESFSMVNDMSRVGDVGSQVFGPFNVFVDASVRDLQSLAPGQRVYVAEMKTLTWIASLFGEDLAAQAKGGDLNLIKTQLKQLGPAHSGTNLADLVPAIQGSKGADDPDIALFVTGYEPPSDQYPQGREMFFVPDKVVLDDRPNPYEEIPLTDYHFDPAATSFWGADFVTDLVPANKFLNKRMSQLGEQANASIYDLVLLGPNLTDKDLPADYAGYVNDGLNEDGKLMVARLPGPSLPGWFMDSIRLVIQILDKSGGSDLMSNSNFPGQLRGPLAVPMLQEILDSEDGPLYQHLGERFARVKQQRINRVKQFYPPVRTLNYAGRGLRDEVLVFHTSEVLRAGTEYNITVDRRSLIPELSALREARVRERLNSSLSILYMDPRTGRPDVSKIARDLQGYDLEREGKEAQGRKFAQEMIAKLWRGEPVEPPMPFYPHSIFMDELEAAMMTSEYVSSSPPIKNAFIAQWNLHRDFLQQQADAAAQGAQDAAVQNAVAQATQQAAAIAAGETVKQSMGQVQANVDEAQGPPNMQAQIQAALASGPNGSPSEPLV